MARHPTWVPGVALTVTGWVTVMTRTIGAYLLTALASAYGLSLIGTVWSAYGPG